MSNNVLFEANAKIAFNSTSGDFFVDIKKREGLPEGLHQKITDSTVQDHLDAFATFYQMKEPLDLNQNIKLSSNPLQVMMGIKDATNTPLYYSVKTNHMPAIVIYGGAGKGKTFLSNNFVVHALKHDQFVSRWSEMYDEVKGIDNADTPSDAIKNAIKHYDETKISWVILDGEVPITDADQEILRTGREKYPNLRIIYIVQNPHQDMLFNSHQIVLDKLGAGVSGNTRFHVVEPIFGTHDVLKMMK